MEGSRSSGRSGRRGAGELRLLQTSQVLHVSVSVTIRAWLAEWAVGEVAHGALQPRAARGLEDGRGARDRHRHRLHDQPARRPDLLAPGCGGAAAGGEHGLRRRRGRSPAPLGELAAVRRRAAPAVGKTTLARLRAEQALTVYLGERGTKPNLSDHARALVSAGRAVDLSATAIATIAGNRHGVRGCQDAVAVVERSAEVLSARVVAAASREPLPPVIDPERAVLDCFRTLDDRGRDRVHAALRLIWAEAWLQSIDDLARHLAAQDDARPVALAYASR